MEEMEPPVSDTEYRRELGLLSKDELVKDSEGYIEDEGISWNEAFPESVEDAKGDTVSEQTQQEKADVIEKVEKAVIENARDVSEDSESRKKAPVVRKIHFDDDTESVSSGESTVKSDSVKEAAKESARSSKAEQAEKELAETSSIEPEKPVEDYPYNQREAIEGYADGVDSNLLSLVEKVYSGTSDKFTRVNLGQVDEKAAQDISKLVDFSVENNSYAISTSGIQHVKNRHGKNGTHDNTMANPEDVARIPFIIHNYDNIELLTDHNGEPVLSSEYRNSDDTPAKMLRMSKKINGVYYVVEAVPESKYKKIWVVSAYISKNDVTQVLNADDSSTLSSKSSETPLVSPSFDNSIRENNVGNVSENVNVLQNKTNTAADKPKAAVQMDASAAPAAESTSDIGEVVQKGTASDALNPSKIEQIKQKAVSPKEALDNSSPFADESYSEIDKKSSRAAEALSGALGVNIKIFSDTAGIGNFYDSASDTLYINGDGEFPVSYQLRRGLMTMLASTDSSDFAKLREFLVGKYKETFGKDAYTEYAEKKKQEFSKNGLSLDENGVNNELCADLGMRMLSDADTAKAIAKELRTPEAKKLLRALEMLSKTEEANFDFLPTTVEALGEADMKTAEKMALDMFFRDGVGKDRKNSYVVAESTSGTNTAKGIFDETTATKSNPATKEEINSYIDYSLEYAIETKEKGNVTFPKQREAIDYGEASERMVDDLKNDVDVAGKRHVLRDNDIRHIVNSHGENTNEKYPITASDLKQIPDIVENYDDVLFVPHPNGNKGIYYVKQHNGTTYYLEAIAQNDALIGKQMIKVPTGTIPDIRELQEAINKKWSAYSRQMNKIPRMYVQDVSHTAPFANSIPENNGVNNVESVNNLQNKAASAAVKTDVEPEVTAKTDVQAEPEGKAEARPEVKTEERPGAKSDYVFADLPEHTVEEGKHTKTGEPIYILKLKDRVSTDDYKAINTEVKAKGGYYSRYAKGFIVPKEIFDAYNAFADGQKAVDNSGDVGYNEVGNVKDVKNGKEGAEDVQGRGILDGESGHDGGRLRRETAGSDDGSGDSQDVSEAREDGGRVLQGDSIDQASGRDGGNVSEGTNGSDVRGSDNGEVKESSSGRGRTGDIGGRDSGHDGLASEQLLAEESGADTEAASDVSSAGKKAAKTVEDEKKAVKKVQTEKTQENAPEVNSKAESEIATEGNDGISEEARGVLETIRRTAQSPKEALRAKKQGGIYSGADEQVIRTMEDLSKAFGARVLLFDGNGKTDIDGFYDRNANTIYLNAGSHAKPIQATVRHEMIHYLAQANKGAFESFRDFVAGRYAETYGEDAMNTWLDKKKAEYEAAGMELDENGAKEELCADLAMDMLTDPETVKGFAKENRSAARRILDALRRFIDKIRAVFGLEPKYTVGKASALEALSKTDSTVKVTDGKIERSHASFKNDTLPKALNVKDLYAAEKLLYGALTSAEIRNSNTNSDGIRFSGETDSDTDIITVKDIDNLRSIGRKSVNDFTSEDIKKAEPFARRYFKELGVKSPFFRAWFGDWRAHDTSKIKPIHVNTHKSEIERGHFVNEDTGWNIGVSSVGINDTISHSGKEKLSVIAMNNLGDIIRNSVLLDSETSQTGGKKGSNTMFMHKLYAPTYIGNRLYVSKLTVEEYRSGTDTNKRFYNLAEIKMSPALGGLSDNNTASTMRISDDINSVTQLYSFVKAYDKDFHAKDANPSLLDEDGKPLVVYHGTDADFTVFKSKDGNYWFSASEDYAEAMAEERGGNRVMQTYLNMRKPYYAKLKPSQFSDPNFEAAIIREAKSKGYDGVIIENDTDNDLAKDTFYVVFNPEQIKSATDNIGTFDGSNADIRFSVSETDEFDENIMDTDANAETLRELKQEAERKASSEYDKLLQEEYNKRQVLYNPDEGKSVKREDLKKVDKEYLERTERQLMNRLAQRID